MRIQKLIDTCLTCTVCHTGEPKNPSLVFGTLSEPFPTFLIIVDEIDSKLSTKINLALDGATITKTRRCETVEDHAKDVCSVYTRILMKHFRIVWMNKTCAKVFKLEFEEGKVEKIDGCTILFGSDPLKDCTRLLEIKNELTNLNPLIATRKGE